MSGEDLLRETYGDVRRAQPKRDYTRAQPVPRVPPARRPAFTRDEQDELYERVAQAWELRDSPYLSDAVAAIVNWYERRRLTRLEQQKAAA